MARTGADERRERQLWYGRRDIVGWWRQHMREDRPAETFTEAEIDRFLALRAEERRRSDERRAYNQERQRRIDANAWNKAAAKSLGEPAPPLLSIGEPRVNPASRAEVLNPPRGSIRPWSGRAK